MTSVGEVSLFDDVLRASAEQWISLIEECERAGYYVCPVDEVRCHWFLIPVSLITGPDH